MSCICKECLSEYVTPEDITCFVETCEKCDPNKYDTFDEAPN